MKNNCSIYLEAVYIRLYYKTGKKRNLLPKSAMFFNKINNEILSIMLLLLK